MERQNRGAKYAKERRIVDGNEVETMLLDSVQAQANKMEEAAPVFPTLYGKSSAGKSGLSMAFGRLMERAGIEQGTIRERGDGVGRKVSARSFHSLRHSFNTVLVNAGVPQELRMKLTGHSSTEMNALYSHHELSVIRSALEHLPRLIVTQG